MVTCFSFKTLEEMDILKYRRVYLAERPTPLIPVTKAGEKSV